MNLGGLRQSPMIKKYSTHSWIGSFAGRLMQLQPDLSVASAVRCAVESIHHSTGLDPHQAAEAFASTQRMGQQPLVRVPVSDHSVRYQQLFAAATPAFEPAAVRPPVRTDAEAGALRIRTRA
jgi:hypothetical protein